jgi:hypothetical protein
MVEFTFLTFEVFLGFVVVVVKKIENIRYHKAKLSFIHVCNVTYSHL